MKLDQIECFLKLSETLNFSETAIYLSLTQPSVTRKIQALEESLKTTLFIRSKHSVMLTQQGKEFLTRVKPLYSELGTVMDFTQDAQKNLSGILRIGVLPEIGKSYFYPKFLKFIDQHPDIQLQVDYALNHENIPRLLDGKLDFAITTQMPESDLYRAYKILDEKSVVVTHAKNPQIKNFTSKGITELPFIGYTKLDGLLNLYLKTFHRPLDLSKIKKISSVNDHASMIRLLLNSQNFAVMPWFSVEKYIQSGELVQVNSHEIQSTYYSVELNKSYRSKKEQEFRSFILPKTKSPHPAPHGKLQKLQN